VKVVDANVLIFASNEDAEYHLSARSWLASALSGSTTLIVPWLVAIGYLRVITNPKIFRQPAPVPDAVGFITSLVAHPTVVMGEPDIRHLDRVQQLLAPLGRGGDLVNDAHVAALALQYGASVVSYDLDFRLFPDVRWERPPTPEV
jgi:uncharacterized protein